MGILGIRLRQCSGPASARRNHNFNNFLAFAKAAFDANFGAILAEKFLVQFHCEILGDLIAILSGGESRVTCGAIIIKHVQRSLPMRGSLKATFM